MAKFKKFGEFLNKKPKELIDVKDGLAGEDYDGPLSTKPNQQPTKGKHDKALPYKTAVDNDDAQIAYDQDPKKGLAFQATPGITPETSPLGKKIDKPLKSLPKPKKLTSEEFVNITKDMTDAQFVKFISESNEHGELPTVSDLFGNEFTPDPTQTFEYVASLITSNPNYTSKFLRELKRRGGFGQLMSEIFTHSDSYDSIIDHLEDEDMGKDRCSRMGRLMNERHMKVLSNFDFGDDEMDESVSPDLDTLLGPSPGGGKGGSFGGGGADNTPDPNYTKKGPPQGGAFGGGGLDNTPDPNYKGNGSPMGGQMNPQFAGQPPVMPPKKMKDGNPPKYKGKSAAINMIKEFSGYPHFKKAMLDHCSGPDC